MLSDTSPEAEKVQIELLRRATPAERLASMRSLTAWAARASRSAIAEANPHLSAEEAKLMWVEIHYGRQLADRVREYLRRRQL